MTELGYQADNAGSGAKNPLQPILLVFCKDRSCSSRDEMLQRRKPGLWWHLLTDVFGIVWWNIDSERPYCRLFSHECSWKDSNQTIPRDCRRRKYCRLDFRIPTVPDSSWTLLSCRWKPLKEKLRLFLCHLSWICWWPSRLERQRYKLSLLWAHHVERMSTITWRANTAGYHLHTNGY